MNESPTLISPKEGIELARETVQVLDRLENPPKEFVELVREHPERI